ncbi:MAG: transposase [Saprospirales bacterium]|nr:transposase [Saprospirales bacterium]
MATEVEALKQRIAWFERMLFGRKSERFVPAEEVAGSCTWNLTASRPRRWRNRFVR